MQFNLLANGELIGSSELEGADPSMGVRIGRFVPNENYSKYQSLFREHSEIRTGMQVQVEPPDEYKRLRIQLDSLQLRIETSNGEKVGTVLIDLEDFSEELGEEGFGLSLVVDDRSTYERFFG
jgi:hypothetical protein